MNDRREALERRLFASVRRERPSAELRERVLALGRAERERLHERRVGHRTLPRRIGWGLGLAAAAALIFVITRDAVDRPSIVMSAEQSGAPIARATSTPEHTGESSVSGPPEAPAQSPSVSSSDSKRVKERRSKPLQAEGEKADAGRSRSVARSTLAEQLEQIKSARAALRAGEPIRALLLLDAYTARSGGELGAEASLLRIEALAASGRRAEAAGLARKFAVDHPNSPLIDRAMAFARE